MKRTRRKRLMRRPEPLLIALFCLCLMGFGLRSLTDEDPTISERENRTLKAYPKFTLASFSDGSYFKDAEEAYNDTFPFRDAFLDIADGCRKLLSPFTQESNSVAVISDQSDIAEMSEEEKAALQAAEQARREREEALAARRAAEEAAAAQAAEAERLAAEEEIRKRTWPEFGTEGYEFPEKASAIYALYYRYNRTDGAEAGRISRFQEKSVKELQNTVSTIRDVQDAFPDSNLIVLVPPTSVTYYAEDQYRTGAYSQKDWLELLYRNLPDIIYKPDLYAAFEARKDDYLFFTTDHHWTQLGAWVAYDAVCSMLGLESVDPTALETYEQGDFYGNLFAQADGYKMRGSPDTITFYKPAVETSVHLLSSKYAFPDVPQEIPIYLANTEAMKYHSFIGGDNGVTLIESSAGTGRTALVLKDSYANPFVPWLAHNYDTVYVVDPRHVNTGTANLLLIQDYLQKEGIAVDDVYFIRNALNCGDEVFTTAYSRLLVPEVSEAFRIDCIRFG